ncbi:hypothetical protein BDR04DRAFT_596097 [Suillus decipiens]|nr:hypothetical protein BDR04DRAFT_596097 [Suillus decipiens]
MRFSFLATVVALATSIMSVTARRPECSPDGVGCTKNSDCCGKYAVCISLVSILFCIQFSPDATHPLRLSPRVMFAMMRLLTTHLRTKLRVATH